MASALPSPAIVDEGARVKEEHLRAAVEMSARRRPLSWRLWMLGTIAMLVTAAYFLDRQGFSAHKPSVPYARESVISTTSAGTALSPSDFAAARSTSAAATQAQTTTPTATPTVNRHPGSQRRRMAAADESGASERMEVLVGMKEVTTALAAPLATRAPVVLNVGTRFDARFLTPVLTGSAPGIASAETAADILGIDGQVAIPKGSRLEGEAIAIEESDRAQIAFKALVVAGKTLSIRGLVIGTDGQPGVSGRVLKKGSKGKGLAGRILGAAADVAGAAGSFVTGVSFPQEVAGQLAQSATGDVKALSAAWRRSNKVVQVASGVTVQVYLSADVEVR